MLRPAALTAAIAVVWLVLEPHSVDMAAHRFRADLFGAEGFTIWNGQWYGGHHTPAYSVLFPPLAWLLGPWAAGALAAVAAAALFRPLAVAHFGRRGVFAAWWFAVGMGALLFTGRLPFALGVAIGVGALLALQRARPRIAAGLAVATALASPIAAAFLALAGVAVALARGPRAAVAMALAALAPVLLMGATFPEGGHMPFAFTAYLPVPAFCVVLLLVLPRRERALRIGAALYALATTAALLIETPMGSNSVRLASLFAGPVVAGAVPWPRRAPVAAAFALGLAALAFWQFSSPARDFAASQNEPSADPSYHRPLVEYLRTHRPEDGRVEIPFTRSHWEAAEVAREFPLARGWERQLDAGNNSLFYDGILNDFTYANWLAEHAVQLVALADVKPDESSFRERALIERRPAYLRLVRRLPRWRVYEVTLPHPMVVPRRGVDIELVRHRSDELDFDVRSPGPAVVRVHWSPYWRLSNGCVERAGDWTRIVPERRGDLRLRMSFSPVRALFRGPRCS